MKDGHPLLLLTGGSLCPNTDDMRAMTAIRFICDTSVFGSGLHPWSTDEERELNENGTRDSFPGSPTAP